MGQETKDVGRGVRSVKARESAVREAGLRPSEAKKGKKAKPQAKYDPASDLVLHSIPAITVQMVSAHMGRPADAL